MMCRVRAMWLGAMEACSSSLAGREGWLGCLGHCVITSVAALCTHDRQHRHRLHRVGLGHAHSMASLEVRT